MDVIHAGQIDTNLPGRAVTRRMVFEPAIGASEARCPCGTIERYEITPRPPCAEVPNDHAREIAFVGRKLCQPFLFEKYLHIRQTRSGHIPLALSRFFGEDARTL